MYVSTGTDKVLSPPFLALPNEVKKQLQLHNYTLCSTVVLQILGFFLHCNYFQILFIYLIYFLV